LDADGQNYGTAARGHTQNDYTHLAHFGYEHKNTISTDTSAATNAEDLRTGQREKHWHETEVGDGSATDLGYGPIEWPADTAKKAEGEHNKGSAPSKKEQRYSDYKRERDANETDDNERTGSHSDTNESTGNSSAVDDNIVNAMNGGGGGGGGGAGGMIMSYSNISGGLS
jgi:hypothetical protein